MSDLTLEFVLQELDAAEARAARLVSSLSEAQANWHPSPGAWSVAQCLDHLAKLNVFYTAALQQAVDAAKRKGASSGNGLLRPGWFGRWFIRAIGTPGKLKAKAVPASKPPDVIAPAVALESFLRSHDPIRRLVSETGDLDLNRIRYRNPIAPGLNFFSVAVGLLVLNAHDRRHLLQAEQVVANLSFPKNG